MHGDDEIYESGAFRLLAQGMKDREAYAIVVVLKCAPKQFECFERWADEILQEQEQEND